MPVWLGSAVNLVKPQWLIFASSIETGSVTQFALAVESAAGEPSLNWAIISWKIAWISRTRTKRLPPDGRLYSKVATGPNSKAQGTSDTRKSSTILPSGGCGLSDNGLGRRYFFAMACPGLGVLGPTALVGFVRRGWRAVLLGGHDASPVFGGERSGVTPVATLRPDRTVTSMAPLNQANLWDLVDCFLSSPSICLMDAEDSSTSLTITATHSAAPAVMHAAIQRPGCWVRQ
jgi:hypothetical protein